MHRNVLVLTLTLLIATPAMAHGPNARPVLPKRMTQIWLRDIGVGWTPAFPSSNQGYEAGTIDFGPMLRGTPQAGGWSRRRAPSIVTVYDPTNEEHAKRLLALDADSRFATAAHLFNCFKVDARGLADPPSDVTILVYDTSGIKLGHVVGDKLRKAFDLMREAYLKDRKRKLTKVIPRVHAQLGELARCDFVCTRLESRIVCTDCGKQNEHVLKVLRDTRKRRQDAEDELARLRAM